VKNPFKYSLGTLTILLLALTPSVVPVGVIVALASEVTVSATSGDADGLCDQVVGDATGVAVSRTSILSVDYCIVTFTNVGSTTWTAPVGVATVDFAAVGGGGGGGAFVGGGGAGGQVREVSDQIVSAGLTITVGAGGVGARYLRGVKYRASSSGDPSSLSAAGTLLLSASGGSQGGSHNDPPGGGETGGGGGCCTVDGKAGGQGLTALGGAGFDEPSYAGGGGAGARTNGGNATSTAAGNGGDGVTVSLNGVTYGGGGGGGVHGTNASWPATPVAAGSGGNGGGGDGAAATSQLGAETVQGASGQDGFGGGGGGAGKNSGADAAPGQSFSSIGGDGGSGVVIVRYSLVPDAPTSPSASPGDGSVSLSWTAPAHTGGITPDYYVQYLETSAVAGANDADWLPESPDISGSTDQLVTGLTNGVDYTFRISATNSTVAPSRHYVEVVATPRATQSMTWSPGPTWINTDITTEVNLSPVATVLGGVSVTYAVTSTTGSASCAISDSSTPAVSSISGSGTCVITATSAEGSYFQATQTVTLTVFDGTGSGNTCDQNVSNLTVVTAEDGTDCVVAFKNGTGSWTVPAEITSVGYLVIGGGGGGGSRGGGGAGAFIEETGHEVTPLETISLGVGAGGSRGSTSAAGSNGTSSTFDGAVAHGGGGGSSTRENVDSSQRGIIEASFTSGQGGSGGGGMAAPPGTLGSCDSPGQYNATTNTGRPAGSSGIGERNAGGASVGVCYEFSTGQDASFYIGGGGGGAAEAGFDVSWASQGESLTGIRLPNGSTGNLSGIGFIPGAGGAGLASTVVGSTSIASSLGVGEVSGGNVYFAGGGGGGANFDNGAVTGTVASALTGGYSLVGDGGLGGGSSNGAGTANTGGGGSGWRNGDGGSGVVVIRYTRATQAPFSAASSASSVAFDSSITLSSAGGSGTGAVTYAVSSGDCTVSGSTLTASAGTGSCVVTATKAADASYASITETVTVSLTKAAQAPLSISVDDGALDFGDQATLSSSGGSGTGAVTFSVDSGDCSVSGTTVTATGGMTDCVISAVKAADGNYAQASASNTVTISIAKAAQTITFGALSGKTYGAADFSVSATSSSGLAVAFTSNDTDVCTVSGSTVRIIAVGTCSITATQGGNDDYSSATGVTQTFSVSAKTITVVVTVADKVYDRGTTATVSSGVLSGVVAGDTVSFVAGNASAAFSTAAVGIAKSVTVTLSGNELTGPDAGNYSLIVSGSPTASITAKPITVNVTPAGKTYDGTQAVLSFTTSLSGVEGADAVSVGSDEVSVVFDAPGAGTQTATATVTASVLTGADAGNYVATVGTVSSAVIAKASQASLSFTSAGTVVFGQTLTLVATGGSGSGSITYGASGDCTLSSGVITPTGAGSCSVTATRAADSNFLVSSSASQTVTILKANQSINFTSSVPVSAVSGTTYTPTATATSGLTVSFSITTGNGTVCSLASGVVSFAQSGTCVITAAQAGNDDYNAAATATQTIEAGKINQTITFPAISAKNFDDPAFAAGASVSSGRTVTYATSTGSVCAVNASTGVVSIKTIGDCTVTASSAGDTSYAPASDVSRTFTISPVLAGKPSVTSVSFGDSLVTVAFVAPGFVGGDAIDGYQVVATSTGGAVTKPDCGTSSPCTITGLTNGTFYTLTVAAINAAGVGPVSDPSPAITPATIPDAVAALRTTPGNTQLLVEWTALTDSQLGGGTFTQYDVYLRVSGGLWGAPITPDGTNNLGTQATNSYTFTGLTNGQAYDVKVVAKTSVNQTALSSNTSTALGVPATVPDAPRDLAVVALSNTTAVASWAAPLDDGGDAVSAYTVNLSCTFVNPTDTFCELSGLSAGSRATVTVGATNLMGTGSTISVSVTMPGGSPGNTGGSGSAPSASAEGSGGSAPMATPRRVIVPPQPTPVPRVLTGPVVSPGRGSDADVGIRATIGGAPATVTKRPLAGGGVSVQAGVFQLDINLEAPQPSNTAGVAQSDVTLSTGQSTRVSGGGLLPGSSLQVWLPGISGTTPKELARIPVKADGTFDSKLSFTARQSETPLPIGRQVMQVTGYDEDGNQTVVDMTINIAQGAPAPEPNRIVNALPALNPGQSLATSAGLPERVTIEARLETREVSVLAGDWSFTVSLPENAGVVEEVESGARLTLIQARTVAVSGDGFQPDTRVDIWLFSDPTLLGSVTVSADGSFTGEVYLDARFAVLGEHTLQLQGVAEDGFIKAANLGVEVQEPVELTSDSATGLLWSVVGAFVLAGALIVLLALARRRRSA